MLDLPFGCSFQLRRFLFALTLMHIIQQNAWVLLSQLNLTFGCSYFVSSWPTWATCACSGKEGNFFPYNIHSPSLSSYFKINLNFSPSKFCDMSKLAAGFVFSLRHCYSEKLSKRHLSNEIYFYKHKMWNCGIHRQKSNISFYVLPILKEF